MDANSLLVHFAGNTVRFTTQAEKLKKALVFHFQHCAGAERNAPLAHYKIATLAPEQYSALRNDESLFAALNFRTALWQLTQDAITELNGAASEALIFHAAALAHQSDGLLLCGKSGSGKSSLTAWLVAEGLQYLTDEVISRPVGAESVHGLSRAIVLKAGSAFIWRHWLADSPPEAMLRFADDSVWIEPTRLNPQAIIPHATPRILIFPRYAPDVEAGFRTKRITAADALFRLLQNLVNARNFPDHGFTETSRLAQETTAYEIIFSDIEKATAWIRKRLKTG